MLRNYTGRLLKSALFRPLKGPVRKYTPRRALMYVPADDWKKVEKAFTLDVDCIMLDCEDGVALNKKTQARINIREALDSGKPERKRKYDLGVRVNAVSSELLKKDLSVIMTGKSLPDTIYLPKVESSDNLALLSDYLNEFVKTQQKIDLIIGIESAYALVKLEDICSRATKMAENAKFTPAALLFGSDDFCASIRAKRSETSMEVIYARQKVVTLAKAFNLQAIDMVHIKFKDLEGLKKQAEEGAQWGFTGKQVIHPGQIEITQNAFLPSEKEIEWASDILKEFRQHQNEGKGAFVYKGFMIDMPTVKQAENIMNLVEAIKVPK